MDFNITTPLDAARFFEYTYKQMHATTGLSVSIVNIKGKKVFNKYKTTFEKLFDIFSKYKLDLERYIRFCIKHERIHQPDSLLSKSLFKKFSDDLQLRYESEKIYNYFLKSVENIVQDCIDMNFSTSREYFGYLIRNNKLGEKYLTGKISVYYLSSIHNIDKLINKMDNINRDTLNIVKQRYDKFNTDLQNAFLLLKSKKVNTLQYTDEQLFSKLTELSASK